MKSQDIHLTDWMRILIGEVPGSYLIEIIIRIAFVYLLLTVSMRLMGKRMASQLSRNELAAMVSLAAAVGIPILAPDRGLLPAIVVALVIVSTGRFVSWLSFRSRRFEELSQGNISLLVEDAVLKLDNMKSVRITRERLMAQLRSAGLFHLGQVKRLYIESNGSFTLIQDEHPRPGLSVLPTWDDDFQDEQKKSSHQFVCTNCGNPRQATFQSKSEAAGDDSAEPCDNCRNTRWILATEA